MKRTRMSKGTSWAVTTNFSFWKELELFVVRVTGDRAGGADAASRGTGDTKVDSLADMATGISAVGERIWKCQSSFLLEFLL